MSTTVVRIVARLSIGGLVLVAGCGNRESTKTKPAKTAAVAPKQPRAPFVPVDACSLLTKAEIEALTRKPVAEPHKEELANLVTCSYGDPKSPLVAGRPLSKVVTLAVFTGEEGAYYAGAVAQARDIYEMARKNAGSAESVSGLGESAYWNKLFHDLSVYKGKYQVTVTVEGANQVELAKNLMSKALGRLP